MPHLVERSLVVFVRFLRVCARVYLPLLMCIYVCFRLLFCACVFAYIYVHVCVCLQKKSFLFMCIYVCVRLYFCACVFVYILHVCVCSLIFLCVHFQYCSSVIHEYMC